MKFKCLVVNQKNKTCEIHQRQLADYSLLDSEVWIKSTYSGINYKDALGVTFTSPIYKKDNIVPGIDVAGYVYHSKSKKFKVGDLVLANGMGLGESFDGGYSEFVKIPDDKVILIPKGLSDQEAMILGTSGFTAALAVERMILNGQTCSMGPILVSGATGGVGQFAIQILNQLGFFVEAVTSKLDNKNYLERIGAHHVSLLKEHLVDVGPLEKAMFGGAIDNLGGPFLESIIPKIELWGNVASIGLALNPQIKTTVMPFILRGVSLLGASSNNCAMELRQKIWNQLASEWKPKFLKETLNQIVSLNEVIEVSKTLMDHSHVGKTIIKF